MFSKEDQMMTDLKF